MMIEAMKRKQKEKAMAFDWDAFKKKEKAKQQSDMFALPTLKTKGEPIEKKWEEEEEYQFEEPDDDDDTPYIKLYLEMCAQGKTCEEYLKKGTCRHIYYFNFDEYRHKNHEQYEDGGSNALRACLWKWIAKYDGEMELKLRMEVEFAEWERIDGDESKTFAAVDVVNSFRTKKENWELAWMHRVEFDRFYHESSKEFVNYGTSPTVAGPNLDEFEYVGQGEKKSLAELLEKCDSKYSGEMIIIRSEFRHIGCEEYEVLGKCYHIEDMIAKKVFYETYLREAQVMKSTFLTPLGFEAERTMEAIAANVQLDEVGEIPDDHEDDGY